MDLRRSLLAGLERLGKREGSAKERGEMELLRGDVMLLLHRLHYLECRLADKEKRVKELEEKMHMLRT
jgi:hypothetical protein